MRKLLDSIKVAVLTMMIIVGAVGCANAADQMLDQPEVVDLSQGILRSVSPEKYDIPIVVVSDHADEGYRIIRFGNDDILYFASVTRILGDAVHYDYIHPLVNDTRYIKYQKCYW